MRARRAEVLTPPHCYSFSTHRNNALYAYNRPEFSVVGIHPCNGDAQLANVGDLGEFLFTNLSDSKADQILD